MHGTNSILDTQRTLSEQLATLSHDVVELKPRSTLVHVGDVPENLYFIRSGWVYRFQLLADGRRQIFSFYTVGDLVAPCLLKSPRSYYSLAALTEGQALVVNSDRLFRAMAADPLLMDAMFALIAFHQRYIDERMVELGRLTAYERVCVLIARLASRLQNSATTLQVPLTRDLISDALGITSVHASRTLKVLEDEGVVRWDRQSLQVLDLHRIKDAVPRGFNVHSEALPFLI